MDDAKREKEELVEMFGVHFEQYDNLPPLASRIMGLLIVDSYNCGLTFEFLTEVTGASKSSVSTNLNLLLKMGKIKYYTIPCDRKKYYRPAPLSERFARYLKIMKSEKDITDRMLQFRKKTAQCNAAICNMETTKAYQDHLLEVEDLLLRTIERFKKIEDKINSTMPPSTNQQHNDTK